MQEYVHLEWLSQTIAIVRVYERAVSTDHILQGEPYIFHTVLCVQENDMVLLKGAIHVPRRVSRRILTFVAKYYNWSGVCWERPKGGYMTCLMIERGERLNIRLEKHPIPYNQSIKSKLILKSA